MHQSTQKSFGDASEMCWKSMEFDMQGCTLTHMPRFLRQKIFIPLFLCPPLCSSPHLLCPPKLSVLPLVQSPARASGRGVCKKRKLPHKSHQSCQSCMAQNSSEVR